MLRKGRWISPLLLVTLAACSTSPPGRHDATPPTVAVSALAPAPDPTVGRASAAFEPTTAPSPGHMGRATVVLRVKLIAAEGGDKYHWDRVEPLEVIKNDSPQRFDAPFRVAHYGWKAGIPAGESIIYLEPYGDPAAGLWRLLEGDGAVGVGPS